MSDGPITPRWAYHLLWMNLVATVLVPVVQLALSGPWSWAEAARGISYSIAYGNSIAIPSVLLMPRLVHKLGERKIPLVPSIAALCVLLAALGCLIGTGILIAFGVVAAADFWRTFLGVFRYTAVMALAFGLGAFFYQSMRAQLHDKELAEERALKLAAEARLASLESRLNPHFLFNTLNAISALIPQDPLRAEEVVGKLARLLRSSLDSTRSSLIPLQQELAIVRDYVEIETARLGPKLRGAIEVPADLAGARVPPLAVQSLVENAVKHGVVPQRGGGDFRVAAASANGNLHIEVSDSGPGFDLATIPAGHGLENLVARLDALFGDRASLNVRRVGGRCVVEMVLPR